MSRIRLGIGNVQVSESRLVRCVDIWQNRDIRRKKRRRRQANATGTARPGRLGSSPSRCHRRCRCRCHRHRPSRRATQTRSSENEKPTSPGDASPIQDRLVGTRICLLEGGKSRMEAKSNLMDQYRRLAGLCAACKYFQRCCELPSTVVSRDL
jgi:hypothetical protein